MSSPWGPCAWQKLPKVTHASKWHPLLAGPWGCSGRARLAGQYPQLSASSDSLTGGFTGASSQFSPNCAVLGGPREVLRGAWGPRFPPPCRPVGATASGRLGWRRLQVVAGQGGVLCTPRLNWSWLSRDFGSTVGQGRWAVGACRGLLEGSAGLRNHRHMQQRFPKSTKSPQVLLFASVSSSGG